MNKDIELESHGLGPIVTKRRFAQATGLTEETIRGMIERGYLPSVKVGKHRLLNIALMNKELLEKEFDDFEV